MTTELRTWEEVQEALPPLSKAEQVALKRSIENGIENVPILYLPDGRIIDGHHRWELTHHAYPYLECRDIPEEQAFGLALAMNIARRQISLEQIQEISKSLDGRHEAKKALAAELRARGKTQTETAAIIGVAQPTIVAWESDGTNISSDNGSHPPDYRTKIPSNQNDIIYERCQNGETQEQVAADYKVSRRAIGKIVAKVEKKLSRQRQAIEQTPNASKIILYNADAFDVIPTLHAKSIDLLVTDPPYNVTDNEWDRIGTPTQYMAWLKRWLDAIRPKLKDDYNMFVFCSPLYQARIECLLVDNGWPLKSRIIWSHRNLSMGRDVADKFISTWEMCFHCGTKPLDWPPEWNDERFDVQEHAAPQSNFDDEKLHPTAKPIKLIELFVRVASQPGDLVVDTFSGGGTTGHACKNVGNRNCILIEKSLDYCDTIEQRLGIGKSEWQA